MKRFFAGLCAAFLTAGYASAALAEVNQRVLSAPIWMDAAVIPDDENLPKAQNDDMLPQDKMSSSSINADGSINFTNYVDGYTITIPKTMTIDTSMADVGAKFSDTHRTLRIFKESFTGYSDRQSYLEYSNKFIENTSDHTIESNTTTKNGKYTVRVIQWSRKALSKVKNDKCHYACVDMMIGSRTYTFFFTADKPFYLCGGYMDIVNSLVTFDPSVPKENAYTKGYRASKISHLSQSAQKVYNEYFSEDASFQMGMFAPEKYGGFPKMEEFESKLNYKFRTFLIYTEFPDRHGVGTNAYAIQVKNYISKIEEYFKYARSTGKSIELTLQTPLSRVSDSNMIYEILAGEYEMFIGQYSKLIAKYKDVTVLFRPFNEMNCDWCNYSAYYTSRDPQIYVELYRYLYNKFKAAGCNNTIWVWNPNEKSFPRFKWNDEQLYYPGDDYVDVYGLTGYNTGTYYSGEIWRSFDEIYEPIYKRAEKINEKPMMITEFSCSSVGGDKTAWLEDMFNSLPKYKKIKLGIWWHAADFDGENIARPYFMDTPDGMLDIFKKHLS